MEKPAWPADYSWSFSTASPAIDSFELSSGRVNPEDNYQNLLLDEAFIVRFLQPMDTASVDSAISLATRAGQQLGLITVWNAEATSVVDHTNTTAGSEHRLHFQSLYLCPSCWRQAC